MLPIVSRLYMTRKSAAGVEDDTRVATCRQLVRVL